MVAVNSRPSIRGCDPRHTHKDTLRVAPGCNPACWVESYNSCRFLQVITLYHKLYMEERIGYIQIEKNEISSRSHVKMHHNCALYVAFVEYIRVLISRPADSSRYSHFCSSVASNIYTWLIDNTSLGLKLPCLISCTSFCRGNLRTTFVIVAFIYNLRISLEFSD